MPTPEFIKEVLELVDSNEMKEVDLAPLIRKYSDAAPEPMQKQQVRVGIEATLRELKRGEEIDYNNHASITSMSAGQFLSDSFIVKSTYKRYQAKHAAKESEDLAEEIKTGDFSTELKEEIIKRILDEIDINHIARVGFHATEVLKATGRTKPVPYNLKSKIEKTITRSKKYLSRPHPNFKHDFEVFVNPDYNEEKDNLTIQQLRSSNMLLTEQLVDFNKMKFYRNIAIVVAVVSIIINIILAFVKKKL